MRKIIITFCFLFFLIQSQAQVSGFMGKKFSIALSPGISFPNLSIIKDNYLKVSARIVFNSSVKFEYVIMPHLSVGMRYKFGYNSAYNNLIYANYIGFTEKHTFNSHTFGAYIKLYKKRLLAPLGPFFIAGLNVQKLSLNNLVLPLLDSRQTIASANYSGYDFGLSVAWGNNWILGNSILLGFEVEAMPTFYSASKLRSYYEFNGDGNREMARINFTSEMLKISLNIGFLAF